METPAVSLHAMAEAPGAGEPDAGQRIGPYRVERLLGRGGMGAVYLASRVDFEKQVAIKVLNRGMNNDEVVRRFHHERQILARLEHPNIARLLDGGTGDDGLPYFVMEYVEGEPIDRYCARHGLGVRERLELFRKVCSAVHRAHQNLVVHRDLKPGNILVDAGGEPKLLDFGIAKPLDADGSTAAVMTAAGIQPMTLAYASPEQINNEAITTASDVYSLGVVLYELLTGQPPYRAPGHRPLDLADAIRSQQPLKPSTLFKHRVPVPDPAGELETSDLEPQTPRRRGRRLAGDLDHIVLTALRKPPEERYASVEQLSEDLGRHLEGLPIAARKITFAYLAGKFVRRHKLETALTALVLAAAVGFSVLAVQLRNRAAEETARAELVAGTLVELFRAPDPGTAQGAEITAREILDRGKERIGRYRAGDPRLYARLAATMGEVYYNLGLYPDARQLLEGALADLEGLFDRQAEVQRADLSNDLAAVLWAQGYTAEAEERLRQTLDLHVRLYGEDAVDNVEPLSNLATLAVERGDFETAEELYRRALRIRQTQSPPVAADIADSHSLLGYLLLEKQDHEGAEGHLRKALALRRGLAEPKPMEIAFELNNLGVVLEARGQAAESEASYREALEIRRRVLDPGHPDVAATETLLAALLVSAQRFEEAEELSRRALASFRESKPGHWRIAHAESVLGSCLAGTGRFEDAERLLQGSYPILVRAKRECSRYATDALRRQLDLYDRWGREDEKKRYRLQLEQCAAS